MKTLSMADSREFLVMIWAIDSLRSGRSQNSLRYCNIPSQIIDAIKQDENHIHPWLLEMLVNCYFSQIPSGNLNRKLNCKSWPGFANIYNKMFNLSGAEDMSDLVGDNLLPSLPRMLWQQLPWQINYPSTNYLYRSWYIQNFQLADELHIAKHNIGLADFCFASFAYYSYFLKNPVLSNKLTLESVGLSEEKQASFLKVISLPNNEISNHIDVSQKRNNLISFGRSFLRDFPIIKSNYRKDEIYYAPLNELIMSRATTDLLLDLPKDGGMGDEVGKRFESYTVEVTRYSLTPDFDTFPEYMVKKGVMSSDVLVADKQGELKLIIECKANYLGMEIRNSSNPWYYHENRHNELVKGVVQIWRYCQRLLNGETTRFSINSENTKGIILTLHPWLILATEVQGEILSKARERALSEGITLPAMIPVAFITIDDWERAISERTPDGVVDLVSRHCEKEYRGYMFGGEIINEKNSNSLRTSKKIFPSQEKLPDVMPWWGDMGRV